MCCRGRYIDSDWPPRATSKFEGVLNRVPDGGSPSYIGSICFPPAWTSALFIYLLKEYFWQHRSWWALRGFLQSFFLSFGTFCSKAIGNCMSRAPISPQFNRVPVPCGKINMDAAEMRMLLLHLAAAGFRNVRGSCSQLIARRLHLPPWMLMDPFSIVNLVVQKGLEVALALQLCQCNTLWIKMWKRWSTNRNT